MKFTYEQLRNLANIMYMIQSQMTFYIAAMTDVIAYIDTAHNSATYVEPPLLPTNLSIIINFSKNSSLYYQSNHVLYLCKHDLYLFLMQ